MWNEPRAKIPTHHLNKIVLGENYFCCLLLTLEAPWQPHAKQSSSPNFLPVSVLTLTLPQTLTLAHLQPKVCSHDPEEKVVGGYIFFQPTHCFGSLVPTGALGFVPFPTINVTVTWISTLTLSLNQTIQGITGLSSAEMLTVSSLPSSCSDSLLLSKACVPFDSFFSATARHSTIKDY